MKWTKSDKKFVSEPDHFLEKMRKQIPENDSQLAERLKYEQVAKLRDKPQAEDASDLWDKF